MSIMRRRRLKRLKEAYRVARLPLHIAILVVGAEAYATAFALPLLVLGLFLAFAWLGVFTALFPWVHMGALVVFAGWFLLALRNGKRRYRRPSRALARRRLEKANNLPHRPLDVMLDRPAILSDGQGTAWAAHVRHNRALLKKLRPPLIKVRFPAQERMGLRYGLVALLLVLGLAFGWGGLSNRLLAALDPEIALPWNKAPLMLNAWLTPPEYTGLAPIMIATPAGLRHTAEILNVPTGSVLNVHYGDGGRTPVLGINGKQFKLAKDKHNDFVAQMPVTTGDTLSLKQRWRTLGFWKIHVVPDLPPKVSFSETPKSTEQKSVRLALEASDDYRVTALSLRITPTVSLPDDSSANVELPLNMAPAKLVKQIEYQDLTALSAAGLPVELQLVAKDDAGHLTLGEPRLFTLPERSFNNPIARTLIEERKKLLTNPSEETRGEAANIMAGIARTPDHYKQDPVLLMALRSGAVRLVLDEDATTIPSVRGILWQTALRIENGNSSEAQDLLRKAQRELAEALNTNASEAEIQRLIDKLEAAMSVYLQQLSARSADRSEPAPTQPLQRMNVLTPEDLKKMLQKLRENSANGAKDQARQMLANMQQMLENLRAGPPQLSQSQKQQLAKISELKEFLNQQQQVMDQTFASQQSAQSSKSNTQQLAKDQNNLLEKFMKSSEAGAKSPDLKITQQAMQRAVQDLQQKDTSGAMKRQGEAIKAMQRAAQAMINELANTGDENNAQSDGQRDPFGRAAGAVDDDSITLSNETNVKRAREILDELQRRAGDSTRPRLELDYIDRLLQRF